MSGGARLAAPAPHHRRAVLGDSSTGPLYGPPVSVRCFVDEQTRAVRTPGGEEVTSSSTAYAKPGTDVPPLSRVTLPSGRTTTVIAALPATAADSPRPTTSRFKLQ
ncbi:hypothetical protein [Streptomyces sp. SGAir0957]